MRVLPGPVKPLVLFFLFSILGLGLMEEQFYYAVQGVFLANTPAADNQK
jgi:hypothetical protein